MNHSTSKQPLKIIHLNCSSVTPCRCLVNTSVESNPPGNKEVEIEAFFYIVVVIVFYATSIVLLLVKYARNDDEEKHLKYQYSEFVKRERFQAPRYKNKLALERTKALLQSLEANGGLLFNCPVITISDFADHADSELCTVSGLLTSTLHAGSLRKKNLKVDDATVEFGVQSALETENIDRSTSLCALSYDTGLGLSCLDHVTENDCGVDTTEIVYKTKDHFGKSHSI